MYEIFTFRKVNNAQAKVKWMKKRYGYTPRIIKIRKYGTKNWKFVVVKPKGLRRIR